MYMYLDVEASNPQTNDINQRTNGPVNANLRSGKYANNLVWLLWPYTCIKPQGRDGWTTGINYIFRIINVLYICPFPGIFLLQPICICDLSWPCRKIAQGHQRVTIHVPNFVEISPCAPEKMILKVFTIWRSSWSCDLDYLPTHWFPLLIDAS